MTGEIKLNFDRDGYESFRFDEIAQKISETVDPSTTDVERYVGLEHIDSGDIHIREYGSPDEVKGGKLKCYPGDVIFGKRRAYQRKAALVDFEGICSAHAFVFRANEEVVDPKLFPFFLHSDQFMHRMVDISVGGLSPTINWGDLKGQEFLLPPKDQQAEIAELLWGLQNCIETVREIKVGAEQLVRKLGFDCFYGPGCERVRLAEITSKIQDGSHFSPKVIYENNDGTRFRYVTSKNIRRNRMEFETDQFVDKEFHDSIFPRCDVKEGDALMTKDGANTGMATINHLSNPFSLLSSVCLLRSNSRTSNKYLVHFFNSEIGRFELMRQMTGTAITRLTLVTLGNFRIPLPPIEDQVRFVRSVDEQNQLIELCGSRIKSSRDLLRSTLSILFS